MNSPEIYFYFETKIDKYSIQSLDNHIYGSASTFDTDSWATEIDALDGYPNEGRAKVSLTDKDSLTEIKSTRLAYQELDDTFAAGIQEIDPQINEVISDSDQVQVVNNEVSMCSKNATYSYNLNIKNNYIFNNTMGEITLEIPSEFQYDINEIQIKLNDKIIDPINNEFFTLNKVANNIKITGKDYKESNLNEMYYGVLDVDIPGVFNVKVGDKLTSTSTWTIDNETFTGNIVNTEVLGCVGKIDIFKTDVDGNPLANAEFTVYDNDGKTITQLITNKDGYAISEPLSAGAYTVVETTAPDGYILSNEKYAISIDNANELIHVNNGKGIINQKETTESKIPSNEISDNGKSELTEEIKMEEKSKLLSTGNESIVLILIMCFIFICGIYKVKKAI